MENFIKMKLFVSKEEFDAEGFVNYYEDGEYIQGIYYGPDMRPPETPDLVIESISGKVELDSDDEFFKTQEEVFPGVCTFEIDDTSVTEDVVCVIENNFILFSN